MVKLEIKTAGSARRRVVDVDPCMEVSVLQKLVGEELGVGDSQLKLVFRGKALQLQNKGVASFVDIRDGDSVLAVVAPKAPPVHIQNRHASEDEDDDLKFKLPETASPIQRRLVRFMRDKLKIPDIVLMVAFSFSLRKWLMIFAWFVLAHFSNQWHFGPIYVIATIFCLICVNLGKRREGEISAYSIFNEGFREIPGTLNAERIDRDLRAGML